MVRGLLRAGAKVFTCGRDPAGWERAREQHSELSAASFLRADLTEGAQLEGLFERISSEAGRLDAAVNNAAPAIASMGSFAGVRASALHSTLESDLWMPAQCLKRELALMKDGGSLVNVTSVNGSRPVPGAAMYGAAKAGLEALTRTLALEYAGRGVRINAVAPGVTWTARWRARIEGHADPAAFRAEIAAKVPLGRFAEPREIARAVLWLLGAEAGYVVGHTLVVDGGLALT